MCFLTFLAVCTSDIVTRERLAYAVLIIRESLRHGGMGWLEYDCLFHQQAALNPNLPWNCMDPGLQASTTLAQRTPTGVLFCTLCQDCDHVVPQCALAQLQQQVVHPLSVSTSRPSSRFPSSHVCHSSNEGACTHPGTCTFRHVCLRCFHDHRVRDCSTPARSRPVPRFSRPFDAPPQTSA